MRFSLQTVARIITENTSEGIQAEVARVYRDFGQGIKWNTIIVSGADGCNYQALNETLQEKLEKCEDVDIAEIEYLISTANRLAERINNKRDLTAIYKRKAEKWNPKKDLEAQLCVNSIINRYEEGDIKSAGEHWKALYRLFEDVNEFEQLNAYLAQIDDYIVYDVTDYLKGYLSAEIFKARKATNDNQKQEFFKR